MRDLIRSRTLPWIVLACILAGYAVSVVRLHPTNFFGFEEDDGIYFSSAQAIAQGKGYILPSVPGTPPATKYPVLYPLILSWVWRWNPSFPANLRDAIAVNILFGFAFLAAAFAFLRRIKGINDAEALALTAFCALHPIVGFYSANILSEIPFSAVALWALVIADKATKRDSALGTVVFCGILAGLSTQLRMVGLAIVAGIALAALLQRAWRQFLVFSLCAGGFLAPALWRALFSPPAAVSFASAAGASLGWTREWAYYMNYPAFYKMSVPTGHIFLAMLKHNALLLVLGPSDYLLYPWFTPHVVLEFLSAAAVTAAVFFGLLRQIRRTPLELEPGHCALFFFAIIALVWDYPMFTRFFIPFLPLFAAAFWLESKHTLGLVRKTALESRPRKKAILEGALGFAFAALLSALVLNVLVRGSGAVAAVSSDRCGLLQAKRQAYDWIARSTPKDSRILAYEDASAYLYSGREAMRPMTLTIESFYEPEKVPALLGHMTDVARAIGADYWIVAENDYQGDFSAAGVGEKTRTAKVESVLPLVFSSSDGRVRVYGLGCLHHPEGAGCQAADHVLFPESASRARIHATP